MMEGERVVVISNRAYNMQTVLDSSIRGKQTDIGALAAKDKKSATILVWNYADKDKQSAGEPVKVTVDGLPAETTSVNVTEYRVDETHSNSYTAWKNMGSPQQPTAKQIAELEKAGQLQTIGKPFKITAKGGSASINILLPRQGVSLLVINEL